MRKRIHLLISILMITVLLMTGCSKGSSTDSTNSSTTGSASSSSTSDTSSAETAKTETVSATTSTTSTIEVDKEFTAKDLEVGYDESSAVTVTCNGGNIEVSGKGATAKDGVLTISSSGTYVITGTLTDGQIVVDAGDKDKVQIVLNGVSITCSDSAPIYIKNADKVFITLEENTENTLTDGSSYTQTDDNVVDGVIFSKSELTMNGEGTLNITANYKHGIAAKDQLTITGGTYNITAVKDDINSNDGVRIKAGTFNFSSENGNGISAKNSEDTTKGYVYICGGKINVTNCVEGLEGTAIVIEGGNVNVTSQDDGFNASNGATSATDTFNAGGGGNAFENDTNCYISISGGTISVDASGDGIDSNGCLYISGGTIYVSGPTDGGNGGLDYNGTADITGGTIVVAGSTGMAQGFSDTSTQYSLIYNLSSAVEGSTEVTLKDADGNVVASFTPNKQYQSVVISNPELKKGATYTLTCGDQTEEITLSSVATSGGETQQQMGGPGTGGQNRPGMGGQGRPGMKSDSAGTGNTDSSDSTGTGTN